MKACVDEMIVCETMFLLSGGTVLNSIFIPRTYRRNFTDFPLNKDLLEKNDYKK